jgi:hypothetical protein
VLLNPPQTINPVSMVPSEFRRIIVFDDDQLYAVNCPPTRILPSFCIVIVLTVLLNPPQISKEVSLVPSVFKRTILFEMLQLYVVNIPPTMILPSFCTAMVLTPLLNRHQKLAVESIVPSAFKRAILFAVIPL